MGDEEYSYINDILYINGNIYTAVNKGFIRFSTDLGETWSDKSTGINEWNIQLNQIFSINDILYVTWEKGIYRSKNMGNIWWEIGDVPPKYILHMRLAEDNHLYALSTQGLYRTTEEVVSVDDSDLPKYTETNIVYPNPANDKITIEISDTYVPEKIEIVDLKGNKVYNKNNVVTVGGSTISLSIESIPQGVYIIRLVNQVETRAQILNIVR